MKRKILDDINGAIRSLTKKAQAPGYFQIASGDAGSWQQLTNGKLLRGLAKGIKNAIPGTMDFLGGVGGSIGTRLAGGTWGEGWDNGVKTMSPYSDAVRKAEMAAGGNAVRKVIDGANAYHQKEILKGIPEQIDERGLPTKKYFDYLEGMNTLEGVENGAAAASEMAVTWPMYGKAIGLTMKGISKVPQFAKSVGKMTGISKKVAPVAQGVSSATRAVASGAGKVNAATRGILGKTWDGANRLGNAVQSPAFMGGYSGITTGNEVESYLNGNLRRVVGDMVDEWERNNPQQPETDGVSPFMRDSSEYAQGQAVGPWKSLAGTAAQKPAITWQGEL